MEVSYMGELLTMLRDFLKPEIIWVLVCVALLILEFALPGLVVFFFGVGAGIVALVCLFVPISLNTQLIIFIISSVVLLLALRRWLKGVFLGHTSSKQNLQRDFSEFVGERAVVKSAITPKAGGRVEFHGTSWQAEAEMEIPEGTIVEITAKDNITLKVKIL